MKRIKAACICQVLHFSPKEDLQRGEAADLARREVEQYRKRREHSGTQYRIVEERELPDGSMEIKVIKQYNSSPVGDYLDGT